MILQVKLGRYIILRGGVDTSQFADITAIASNNAFWVKAKSDCLITLDDIAPTITSDATASIEEHSTMTAYTITATDTDTITYSLSGTDAADFTVDSTTGVVTFKAIPDYEVKISYSITVKATDSANNVAEKSVIINITDIDDTYPNTPTI